MIWHLLLGLFIILVGAEFFTNGIEWLGKKFHLSEGTVGNLLAAVGTALPESIIPIVAFCSNSGHGDFIGMGAILGAPFMLGTLAMFVTGLAAWVIPSRREKRYYLDVNAQQINHDLRFFLIMYGVIIIAGLFPGGWHKILAFALFGAYGFYVWQTVHQGRQLEEENLRPLYLTGQSRPKALWIILQLALSLAAIIGGAQFFVSGIEQFAALLGLNPLVVALVIAPIATELPEKFNSVIWIAHQKDGLALGNITGAMVFQSTIIPAFGLLATDWVMESVTMLSSSCVLASVLLLQETIRRKKFVASEALMVCGLGYLVFLLAILWSIW
ncbi:MAG: sodium:calcium antiporter [Peptococcaceae bacterium]|nr:sodium:calcium antiporter [Peptococcaceae bacterium]